MSDLRAIGDTLRQTRESYGYTLPEVEAQTKIRSKFLEALEQGDLSPLPSAAHAKGFLRNYAQFLRLDVNAVIAQFSEATGNAPGAVTTTTAQPRPPAPPPSRPANPIPPATYTQPSQPPPSSSDRQGDFTDAPPIIERSPSPVPITGPQGAPSYVTPDHWTGPSLPQTYGRAAPQAQQQPAQETRPKEKKGAQRILQSNVFSALVLLAGAAILLLFTNLISRVSIEDVVPTPEESQFLLDFEATVQVGEATVTFMPTSTLGADSVQQVFDRVILSIDITQRSWVRVTVDGSVQFQGQVEPGTVLQYEGQEVQVEAGNGAAFNVTYNGLAIGTLGERAEVVNRTFTPTGQITPTPTLTPTLTRTPVPTPTASPAP